MAEATSITTLPLGALLQRFPVASSPSIVLGFPTARNYQDHNSPYFGETIGRVANRISNATIKSLNRRDWKLYANNGPNCNHGGKLGWGKKTWQGPESVRRAFADVIGLTREVDALEYRRVSEHMEEGFPGSLDVRVWYAVHDEAESKKRVVDIEYEARMTGNSQDEDDVYETVITMTNHSYFNITNGSSIDGTWVDLCTSSHLPLDENSIPIGSISASFPGIEAGKPFVLGPESPTFDNCFVLDKDPKSIPLDTRALPLRRQATLHAPSTGIHLEVQSTEPCVQIYTGDGIDVPAVDGEAAKGPRAGVAIEPGRYTNAVNTEDWKNMVLIRRGQVYGSRIRYVAWVD